jgi:mannose-6-phosphate isomerase-like protein (cupin superfamily)
VFISVLLFYSNTVIAQDAAKVAPDKVKVLLDNDKVRVLDFKVKPGEETGMHSHPNHVTYFLVDGKMLTTMPDGKSSEKDVKAGDTFWSEGVTHNNKNMGKTEAHAIVIELKDQK